MRLSNEEVRMAKTLDSRQAVPLEDVVLAQAFQLEALMNLLDYVASETPFCSSPPTMPRQPRLDAPGSSTM
jgi:hypothetical protein